MTFTGNFEARRRTPLDLMRDGFAQLARRMTVDVQNSENNSGGPGRLGQVVGEVQIDSAKFAENRHCF